MKKEYSITCFCGHQEFLFSSWKKAITAAQTHKKKKGHYRWPEPFSWKENAWVFIDELEEGELTGNYRTV